MAGIVYLVAGSEEQGIKDATARGCERIGYRRFAAPDKTDVRVIFRFNDMVPLAGKTPLIRGSDYDSPPEGMTDIAERYWLENHERFEQFIADGHGEWIDG